jgi:hypothetical protein
MGTGGGHEHEGRHKRQRGARGIGERTAHARGADAHARGGGQGETRIFSTDRTKGAAGSSGSSSSSHTPHTHTSARSHGQQAQAATGSSHEQQHSEHAPHRRRGAL